MGNCIPCEETKYTPIHYAIMENNVDAASTLLWRSDIIYDRESNGERAIDMCRRIGSREMKHLFGIRTRTYR
jgi:ankyrin repeat protein